MVDNKSDLPTMQYRFLGRTGLKVSVISLGGWLTHGGHVENGILFAFFFSWCIVQIVLLSHQSTFWGYWNPQEGRGWVEE
jgi:hypothetical protein